MKLDDIDTPGAQAPANTPHSAIRASGLITAAATTALSACGGGGDSAADAAPSTREQAQTVSIGATTKPAVNATTGFAYDAWRFLTQATFGPTPKDLEPTSTLISKGYQAWLNEQFVRQPLQSTFNLTKSYVGLWQAHGGSTFNMGPGVACSAMWEQFLSGPDQLRQRVALALSEIFVLSFRGGDLSERAPAVASYHDLLVKNAFGSLRTLVEGVCKHPAMGLYLTHLRNEAPDGSGRIPDQNFARELMQLFTIGLVNLKMDGSPTVDSSGNAATYNTVDIQVLSHVFTGWGWASGGWNAGAAIRNSIDTSWAAMNQPMVTYTGMHATTAHFNAIYQKGAPLLFTQAKLNPTGVAETDLKNALDVLLAHPNVAPFLARQMIQRLVTSNPSTGYVLRVATQFKTSSFSLKALVQAILLDTEARDVATIASSTTYGKLKEPMLRITSAFRALGYSTLTANVVVNGVTKVKPLYAMSETFFTQSASTVSLGQGPFQAPSVFNFFRPGHVATWSDMGKLGLQAPELQTTSELDVAAYIRFVADGVANGFGPAIDPLPLQTNPVKRSPYVEDVYATLHPYWSLQLTYVAEVSATLNGLKAITTPTDVTKIDGLVRTTIIPSLNRKLLGDQMSEALKTQLSAAMVPFITGNPSIWGVLPAIQNAVTMVMVSSEFVVQK
jgi:uncharacterized protein (DUF1800 family)